MSDISKIKVSGVEYDIKDIQARGDLGNLGTRVTELEQHGGGSSVPKPLTYDYMPEGYPTRSVQTTTLIDYPEVPFEPTSSGTSYRVTLPNPFEIVAGKTYTVNWDGIGYECIGVALPKNTYMIGNLSIMGAGDDTGEPFLYTYQSATPRGKFYTLDTSASHTISVKTTEETVTPMAEEFLPNIPADKLPTGANSTTVFYYA